MSATRLPLRVAYERPQDALTGQPAWSPAGGAWARLNWAQAAFDANGARVLARFSLRRRAAPKIGWRVSFGARVFLVKAIEDARDPAGLVTAVCEEAPQ